MQNSTYNPVKVSDFEKTKMQFNAQGINASISTATVTNIDLDLTDDHMITGAWFIVNGANLGDSVDFQVIDITGNIIHAMSGGLIPVTPGYILNQFISNWFMNVSTDTQFDMIYPAKILAGMALRVVYTSVGSSSVFVAINYKLHEILV